MLCKFRIYYSLLIVFLVGPSFSGISQVLNLKVSGDKESGYYMDILNGDDLLLHKIIHYVGCNTKYIININIY